MPDLLNPSAAPSGLQGHPAPSSGRPPPGCGVRAGLPGGLAWHSAGRRLRWRVIRPLPVGLAPDAQPHVLEGKQGLGGAPCRRGVMCMAGRVGRAGARAECSECSSRGLSVPALPRARSVVRTHCLGKPPSNLACHSPAHVVLECGSLHPGTPCCAGPLMVRPPALPLCSGAWSGSSLRPSWPWLCPTSWRCCRCKHTGEPRCQRVEH